MHRHHQCPPRCHRVILRKTLRRRPRGCNCHRISPWCRPPRRLQIQFHCMLDVICRNFWPMIIALRCPALNVPTVAISMLSPRPISLVVDVVRLPLPPPLLRVDVLPPNQQRKVHMPLGKGIRMSPPLRMCTLRRCRQARLPGLFLVYPRGLCMENN